MMSSRGMGDISPSKMPKGTKTARRDDTDFTQYAKGGKVKKMNEGGESAAEKVKAKRAGKAAGKQFVKQPPKVAAKTARFR